jgi:hypothetical protein
MVALVCWTRTFSGVALGTPALRFTHRRLRLESGNAGGAFGSVRRNRVLHQLKLVGGQFNLRNSD